jgi:hypothetical protein
MRFGGTADDRGIDVLEDPGGDVLLVGTFNGDAGFGGPVLPCAGLGDVFVARYDAAGNHRWSKGWGDAQDQTGVGLALDPAGDVFVTGNMRGVLDFGAPTAALTSAGQADVFLAKLTSAGVPIWAKSFGDAGQQRVLGHPIAADGAGGVVLAGVFQGSLDLGGGHVLTAAGTASDDVFLARFDGNGAALWAHGWGDAQAQTARAVTVSASGRIALVGSFQGVMDFGGGHTLASAGGNDAFVVVFDAAGGFLWGKRFGDAAEQETRAAAFDAAGNLWIAGNYQGAVDLGAGAMTAAGTGTNVFLGLFDPQGNLLRAQRYGDGVGNGQSARGLRVGPTGNVVFGGEFTGGLDFGQGPLTSAGVTDLFLAELTPALTPVFASRWGDASAQFLNALALGAGGTILLTGQFGGSVDFGANPLGSAGGLDVFVARINP